VRSCTNAACATDHFPRSDPATIMLIVAGDKCLLGRSARFPVAMYSTLAGFVEPGESLEDCVRRETFEESGVRVGAVRYHSSQPWPFPASIMLGFYGEALTTELAIDREELVDAMWVTRDFLRGPHDPEKFRLPRADSIARRLIEDWIAERI
jgi:NAD+ diphosphatase